MGRSPCGLPKPPTMLKPRPEEPRSRLTVLYIRVLWAYNVKQILSCFHTVCFLEALHTNNRYRALSSLQLLTHWMGNDYDTVRSLLGKFLSSTFDSNKTRFGLMPPSATRAGVNLQNGSIISSLRVVWDYHPYKIWVSNLCSHQIKVDLNHLEYN